MNVRGVVEIVGRPASCPDSWARIIACACERCSEIQVGRANRVRRDGRRARSDRRSGLDGTWGMEDERNVVDAPGRGRLQSPWTGWRGIQERFGCERVPRLPELIDGGCRGRGRNGNRVAPASGSLAGGSKRIATWFGARSARSRRMAAHRRRLNADSRILAFVLAAGGMNGRWARTSKKRHHADENRQRRHPGARQRTVHATEVRQRMIRMGPIPRI